MSSSDEGGVSRRGEVKKLLFQKNQELKKCKSKTDKERVEAKYNQLIFGIAKPSVVPSEPVVASMAPVATGEDDHACPVQLYADGPKELSKAQRRKEQKAEQEKAHRIAVVASVGDGSVELALAAEELRAIQNRIPQGFSISQIEPNGDCLFASVAVQIPDMEVSELRMMTAVYLEAHADEFEGFVDGEFNEYCDGVRGASWGGHIELEGFARMFGGKVLVFAKDGILEFGSGSDPIRISFHERQYSSCHYNAVIYSRD